VSYNILYIILRISLQTFDKILCDKFDSLTNIPLTHTTLELFHLKHINNSTMPKGTASPAKPKKVASAPAHPKYEDMIRDAIVSLKERKGSSRQAIKKYILSTYKLPENPTTNTAIRLAINKGVEKGTFAFQNGPSGTIKLVKKEKKEIEKKEKKEKPKKEKKEVKPKAEKKAIAKKPSTTKKAITKKATTKSTKKASTAPAKKTRTTPTKRSGEKRAAPKRKVAAPAES